MLSLLNLIQLLGQDIDPGLDDVRAVGEDDEDLDIVFLSDLRGRPDRNR